MSKKSNESLTLSSSKSTPYKSASTTKTLFTPCRRVGLSRNFKRNSLTSPLTPIPSTVPSVTNTISPVITIKESPTVTSSPKQSEEKVQKRNNSRNSRVNIESRFKNEPVEKLADTISATVDNNKSKTSILTISPKTDKIVKKKNVVQKKNKISSKVVLCDNSSQENISKELQEKPKQSPKKIEPKPSKIDSLKANSNSTKTFKRCLSLKKSSSSVLDDLTDESIISTPKTSSSSLLSREFLMECKVNIDKMSEIDEESNNQIIVAGRKKRCLVLSSDDEDFIPSPHSVKKEILEDEDWLTKITEVKKQIKKKEAHLADLKQAALYRKLHDVNELGESIKMWKKCCEEGLSNLLPKVQEHGEMEMSMLLQKFNVPKTIIYDANTNGFIN